MSLLLLLGIHAWLPADAIKATWGMLPVDAFEVADQTSEQAAPGDVGSDAVPVPSVFTSAHPWQAPQPQHPKPMSLAGTSASRTSSVAAAPADNFEDAQETEQAQLVDIAASSQGYPHPRALLEEEAEKDKQGEVMLNEAESANVPNNDQISFSQVGVNARMKKGHSQTSTYQSNAGEEGELMENYADPALLKVAVPVKTDEQLALDMSIAQQQDNVAHTQHDAKSALSRLKASVYHSANMTRFRMMQQSRLETGIRRQQLLADANRYRSEVEEGTRKAAQERAEQERKLHVLGQTVETERELRLTAEADLRTAELELSQQQQSAEAASLRQELDELKKMQQSRQNNDAAIASTVASKISNAGSDAAVRDAAQKFQAWTGREESARAIEGQSAREFKQLFAAADVAAVNGSCGGTDCPPMAVAAPQLLPAAENAAAQAVTTPLEAAVPSVIAQAPETAAPAISFAADDADQKPMPILSQLDVVHTPTPNTLLSVGTSSNQPCASPCSSPCAASPCASPMPSTTHCTPQCMWKCSESPKCDQQCSPVCDAPVCQTRCAATDLSNCAMNCTTPQCTVICPERSCPTGDCPQCTTQCSEPVCKLQCPQTQPCRSVCEQPRCTWSCRAPTSCAKPTCSMVCETPRTCSGSTYVAMPPLSPGEVAVDSFSAGASAESINVSSLTPTILGQPQDGFVQSALLQAGQQQDGPNRLPMMAVPVWMGASGQASAPAGERQQPSMRVMHMPAHLPTRLPQYAQAGQQWGATRAEQLLRQGVQSPQFMQQQAMEQQMMLLNRQTMQPMPLVRPPAGQVPAQTFQANEQSAQPWLLPERRQPPGQLPAQTFQSYEQGAQPWLMPGQQSQVF